MDIRGTGSLTARRSELSGPQGWGGGLEAAGARRPPILGGQIVGGYIVPAVPIRRKYWFRALPGARDTVSIQDYPGPASSGLGYRNLKRKMVRLLSTEVSTPKPAWYFQV